MSLNVIKYELTSLGKVIDLCCFRCSRLHLYGASEGRDVSRLGLTMLKQLIVINARLMSNRAF